MFGKKVTKPEENEQPVADNKPDLVVEKQPETVGMQGFTKDPAPAPEPAPASVQTPAPAPQPEPSYQYHIVGQEISATEGVYVYKIVTNKYLGELGGVYEA